MSLNETMLNSVVAISVKKRLKERSKNPVASLAELKAEGIKFHPNPAVAKRLRRGIPQGTPISAAASNLYMVDFDAVAHKYCSHINVLYRRYSDDVLIICKPDDAETVEETITDQIAAEKLEIQSSKTERTQFDIGSASPRMSRAAQYLGFTLDETGAAIREASLARQWRKMRKAFRRTRKVAQAQIAAGVTDKAYTKKLRRRFSYIKVHDGASVRPLRNFSSYARRSADAFGGNGGRIMNQIKRLERAAQEELKALKRETSKNLPLGSKNPDHRP